MKRICTTIVGVLATALLLSSCGSARIDRSAPKATVLGFLSAIRRGDLDTALAYVIPEERDAWRQDLANGLPDGFPESPQVYEPIEVEGTTANVDIQDGRGNATAFGFDLRLESGEWWLVK